ncbi:MAG: hypothetical protein R3A79_24685 [Nannocystaceae bacterium]
MSDPQRRTPLRLCPVLGLCSARGGVGQSLAALNVAGLLAARGFAVLLVDLDLEAPGVSHLVDGVSARSGAIERLLGEGQPEGHDDTTVAALPEAIEPRLGGSLRVLGAGRLDAEYDEKLARLAAAGDDDGRARALVDAIVRAPARPDFVIVDGGSGRAAARRVAAIADVRVVMTGLGPQHVAETAALLRRDAARSTAPLLVLSPLPDGEDDLVEARRAAVQEALTAAYGDALPVDLAIPYHPQLAVDGRRHVLRGRGRPHAAYLELTRRALERTGDTIEARVAASLAALDADDHAEAQAQLRRARLVDDAAAWIDAFARGFADLGAAPDGAARPLFEAIVRSASGAPRRQVGRALSRAAQALAQRQRLDAAEVRFRAAVEVSPDDANILGAFANFLCDERRALGAAEAMYRRAVAADDENRDNLCNFAIFLCDERRALDEAEATYRRALEVDPEHAFTLCNYATFLADERRDLAGAEAMYRRAIAAEPGDAGNHANLARLLFTGGRVDAGRAALADALARLDEDDASDVAAECRMYAYCCGVEAGRADALRRLRDLIDAGIDTGAWDMSGVVARAEAMGHPEARWLAALAEVLGGRAPASSLDAWSAWTGR